MRAGTRSVAAQWPEVAMEALGLGLFMVSAGLFGTLLEYPASPVRQALPDALSRRALMGVAMGLTAIGLVYSPWGRRSGAHINPAVTWTFFRLGRIRAPLAAAYTAAQFAGGALGVLLLAGLLGHPFLGPPVAAVATVPGARGLVVTFASELVISGVLMFVVLRLGRSPLERYTGWFVGALLFLYITFEAPLSGMSMNPARSLASALPMAGWRGLWVYFTAPLLGMLLAAEIHLRIRPVPGCAKLVHRSPCIFCGGANVRAP
jgi:aquaporin Z